MRSSEGLDRPQTIRFPEPPREGGRPLRVLVISDLYPPNFRGGYEIMCQSAVEGLRRRGHRVRVLTARNSPGQARETDSARDAGIYRCLTPRNGGCLAARALPGRAAEECADHLRLRFHLATFRPDLVYVWHMQGLSASLLTRLAAQPVPIVCHLGDYWLLGYAREPADAWLGFWQAPARRPRYQSAKRLLGRGISPLAPTRPAPIPRDLFFVSRALRDAYSADGLPVAGSPIIYNGLTEDRFLPLGPGSGKRGRLLYVGRVAPEKGVHVAIEALRHLKADPALAAATLTIVGPSTDAAYAARLRSLVVDLGLQGQVRFLDPVVPDRVIDIYARHDIVLVPSLWSEPFGLTIIEGMAAGRPVIGTATGGSAEIMTEGVNSLICPPGNARALAAAVSKVMRSRSLYHRLAAAGQEHVHARFTADRMVEAIEANLEAALCRRWGIGPSLCQVTRGGP
jgi:glycosyltransferase involved in cell wall biosynthesis